MNYFVTWRKNRNGNSMDGDKEDAPRKFNLKVTLTTGAAILTFIATTIGLWATINTQIKLAVTDSTVQITKEIKRSTYEVIQLHKDDLELRERVLKREIDEALSNGVKVPERKMIQLDTYRDQLEDIKDRWKNH